jgi:hypothetical protein
MAILIFNVEAVRIANKMYANLFVNKRVGQTVKNSVYVWFAIISMLWLFEWFLSYCSSERSVAISFAAIAVRI